MTADFFRQDGGARIGFNYWIAFAETWPLAALEIREDYLVVISNKRYVFGKRHITKIETTGIFSNGIRIFHSIPDYPKYIVYWTMNMPEMKRNLTRFNYFLVE